eukprot:GHVT01080761.1.p2 GENE.GHVT01080761.1~~GHVT01080761.1.p2  ORF type:complete len:139 (+),score=24.47 GHVT01080761.1:535-951(+)
MESPALTGAAWVIPSVVLGISAGVIFGLALTAARLKLKKNKLDKAATQQSAAESSIKSAAASATGAADTKTQKDVAPSPSSKHKNSSLPHTVTSRASHLHKRRADPSRDEKEEKTTAISTAESLTMTQAINHLQQLAE